jgi:hypothetical protein
VSAAFALLVVAAAGVKYLTQPLNTSVGQSGGIGGGGHLESSAPTTTRLAAPDPQFEAPPIRSTPGVERAPVADPTPSQRPAMPVDRGPTNAETGADSSRIRRVAVDSSGARTLEAFVTNELDNYRYAEAADAVTKSVVDNVVKRSQLGRIRKVCDADNVLRPTPRACP